MKSNSVSYAKTGTGIIIQGLPERAGSYQTLGCETTAQQRQDENRAPKYRCRESQHRKYCLCLVTWSQGSVKWEHRNVIPRNGGNHQQSALRRMKDEVLASMSPTFLLVVSVGWDLICDHKQCPINIGSCWNTFACILYVAGAFFLPIFNVWYYKHHTERSEASRLSKFFLQSFLTCG